FSSRRRHTRSKRDWSSDVCSSDLIYANPGGDTIAWERPASIELIYPDGTKGFQVDAGIRIRGGFSRSTDNPKHAFRFFFRQEYRSEERRVGKECRSRRSPYEYKKE